MTQLGDLDFIEKWATLEIRKYGEMCISLKL